MAKIQRLKISTDEKMSMLRGQPGHMPAAPMVPAPSPEPVPEPAPVAAPPVADAPLQAEAPIAAPKAVAPPPGSTNSASPQEEEGTAAQSSCP